MRHFIYTTLVLIALLPACRKDSSPPPPSYSYDRTITYVITDNVTNLPVDSAWVNFAYGNAFSYSKHSGSDGKVSFTIPAGWVVNEVTIAKVNYCKYWQNYSSMSVGPVENVTLNHYAYIRVHVENTDSIAASDKVIISCPPPDLGSAVLHPFYGAVNTTFISTAYAGNIGVLYQVYSGSTFLYSNNTYVMANGGDTTDVTINF